MNEDERLALLVTLGMTALGAMARTLNRPEAKPHRGAIPEFMWQMFIEFVLSALIGFLLFFLSRNTNIATELTFVLAGVMGWAGPKAIEGIQALLSARTGIKIVVDSNKEG